LAGTHCAYSRRDGQAELDWVPDRELNFYTVTHPCTNRAWRRLTCYQRATSTHDHRRTCLLTYFVCWKTSNTTMTTVRAREILTSRRTWRWTVCQTGRVKNARWSLQIAHTGNGWIASSLNLHYVKLLPTVRYVALVHCLSIWRRNLPFRTFRASPLSRLRKLRERR